MDQDSIIQELNRRLKDAFLGRIITPRTLNQELQDRFFVLSNNFNVNQIQGVAYATELVWELPANKGSFFIVVELKDAIEQIGYWTDIPCEVDSIYLMGNSGGSPDGRYDAASAAY